jgi:3(or 17)beta-hydroxysteroid dehydrogenase
VERLKGKVAIVTGAAKGLGEADARLFAAEGAQVVVADVDVTNGERVACEIGPRAKFVFLDVRHEAEWQRVIATVMEQYGRLDVLVNNAGVVEMHTPESITEQEYRFVMAVSIDGTVFGCKHAIPAMRKSGGGSIINMASVASLVGEYTVAGYCAAKGAIEAYTRAVAVHCAQNQIKIRCNSIHPAAIDTPMVRSVPDKMLKAGLPAVAQEQKGSVANPMGQPIHVAYLALYLASDESSFVSGQQFVIDNTATVTMGSVPGSGSLAAAAAK